MGLSSSTTTRKDLWNSCAFNLFFADKPFTWSCDHLWAMLNTWTCLEPILLILAAIDSSDWLLNALKDTDEYPVVFTLEILSFLSLKLVSPVSSLSIWPWESWFDCRLWFKLAAASSKMSAYGSNFCLFLLNAFKTEGHANVFWYVLLIIHPLIEMGKTWMTNDVQTSQDICLYLEPDISKLSSPSNISSFHCNSLAYWSLDKHMLHDFFLSADLAEHLVGIHAVDHCTFLILEYNK